MISELAPKLTEARQRYFTASSQYLHQHIPDPMLLEATLYVTSKGKGIRPMLAYALHEWASDDRSNTWLNIACCIEWMHVHALMLDDLPSMDNATSRRHQPCCHIQFDEATTLLVADGLIHLAYNTILDLPVPNLKNIVHCLSQASGFQGLVSGQHMDLSGTISSEEQLHDCQYKKTCALFAATAHITSQLHPISHQKHKAMVAFTEHIGIAFQLYDDWLDAHGTDATLGKNAHNDIQNNTINWYHFIDDTTLKQRIDTHRTSAQTILNTHNAPQTCHDLFCYIFSRTY